MPNLVAPSTRARILSAAHKLGYEPNRAARGLITGKTHNIGVVVPDIANPFFAAMIKSVQRQAHQFDYSLFLADTDEDPELEVPLIRAMSKQVDGVLLHSPRGENRAIMALAQTTKLVTVNRIVDALPAVVFDMADGTRQILEHLAALGHSRMAFLSGPLSSWSNQQRRRAVQQFARRTGLSVEILGPFAPTFNAGVSATDAVLAAGVTACLAYNDLMGLGILTQLAHRGVNVPDEISVVGFDDIASSIVSTPSLTTVAVPTEAAGRTAVDLLLRLLDDNEAPLPRNQVTLATQLMVRRSSARTAKGGKP